MASGLGSGRTPNKDFVPIIQTRRQRASANASALQSSNKVQGHGDDPKNTDAERPREEPETESSSIEEEYNSAGEDDTEFKPIPNMDELDVKPRIRFRGGGDAMGAFSRNMPKLARFTGENSTIKISKWLKLYDVASINCPDTKTKISMMISFLDGEALNFFADEIASKAPSISWAQVVSL